MQEVAAVRSWRLPRIWLPFLVSRLVVWASGVLAMKFGHASPPDDPTGLITALGHTGNILLAPAVRWDAIWYVAIAQHGYISSALCAFFPLYPLLISPFGWSPVAAALAGIVISLVAFWVALEVIYRLVRLDFGSRAAIAAVWAVALFPTALFFSAVYTESLFLALSAGCLYLARRQRWLWAGLAGGCASATRNVGVLLIVPLAILYAQQAAGVLREQGLAGGRSGRLTGVSLGQASAVLRATWQGLVGVLLVPIGLVGFIIGLAVARGTPFAMFNSDVAGRALTAPPVTVIREVRWASHHLYALGHPSLVPLSGFPALVLLALSAVCAVGVWRRLGPAFGAYVVIALLVLLSEPQVGIHDEPMTSFIRYIAVLFPLWAWVGITLHRHWSYIVLLGISTLALIALTTQFATWRFVG